jgi:hypothetical protein
MGAMAGGDIARSAQRSARDNSGVLADRACFEDSGRTFEKEGSRECEERLGRFVRQRFRVESVSSAAIEKKVMMLQEAQTRPNFVPNAC